MYIFIYIYICESESKSGSIMSNSLPLHGILQARILEWIAIPFSRGFFQPRDWTQVSYIADRFFTNWATREAPYIWACPGKESASQCRRLGFDPWVRKMPWSRKSQPTPVSLPGEFHGQKSQASYSPRCPKRLRQDLTTNSNYKYIYIYIYLYLYKYKYTYYNYVTVWAA